METYSVAEFADKSGGEVPTRLEGMETLAQPRRDKVLNGFRPDLRGWKLYVHTTVPDASNVPTRLEGMETQVAFAAFVLFP